MVRGTQSETAESASLGGYRIEDTIAAHLFGQPEQVTTVQSEAPKTRLALSLTGIISSDDPRFARAIITSTGNPPSIYAVGDTLEKADAKLHAIDKDMVLLERNGKFESLAMKRIKLESGDTEAQPATARSVTPQPASEPNDKTPDDEAKLENKPRLPAGLKNLDKALQN